MKNILEAESEEAQSFMPQVSAEEDKLAKFRAQVQAEKESKLKNARSDRSAERLRHLSYEDRLAKQGEERFATALTQITPTPRNLSKLIGRCLGHLQSPVTLERKTYKLLYWVQAKGYRLGHEIRLPEDIAFLSELTKDEIKMSDAQFEAEWKVKKIVKPISDEPKPEPCKTGEKCLWAKRLKPAPAAKGSLYCTSNCKHADIARRKRAPSLTCPTPNSRLSSPEPA